MKHFYLLLKAVEGGKSFANLEVNKVLIQRIRVFYLFNSSFE